MIRRILMKALNPKAGYIVRNGRPTAVILPIAEYEGLLEDLQDLAVIARRKNEPTLSLAEVKARLKKHGLVRNTSVCAVSAPMR
jgi:PHD/YefM family antitoxin component YafN of YafNO toxin-antitoxin module